MKLREKLWNWGHLEGSHNAIVDFDCNCSPEDFAKEYGIENSFIVSYGGNITPPFDELAKRFSSIKRVKWSVLGDASSPLPDDELGNTKDVLKVLDVAKNIDGCVMDDFFSPERMQRFTPAVLKKIKNELNANGLDFWCVLYDLKIYQDLSEYLECFDGISFWIWGCEKIANLGNYLARYFKVAKDKKKMLGVYLYDYLDDKTQPMDISLFEKQLKTYFDLLRERAVEGVIFCSNTVGDMPLETNKMLKEYIKRYGEEEI